MTSWQPLIDELERWRAAGRQAPFWLRDDDAVEPTEQLHRLLALTERFSVPLTLAVIPQPTGQPLADYLADRQHVTVTVHGWAHRNHAPATEKKQELGNHRQKEIVLRELQDGLDKLKSLHPTRALAMLVPPWNRIAPSLLDGLPELGFEAVSIFGPVRPTALAMLNSNVDIMDWHGSRGCRATTDLAREIVAQLKGAFDGGEPVGLLTHHLVHDEAAWTFLQQLFEISRGCASWLSAAEALAAGRE